MILFTILLVTFLAFAVALFVTVATGGTVVFALFGDVIIFVLLIVLIVKLIRKLRKK